MELIVERREIVRFTIPFLPPSMNSLYGISTKGGGVKVFLKSEGRTFKEKAKLFMPPRTIPSSLLLDVEAKVYDQWFSVNGNVKKKDITNLDKILMDAIAEKYLDLEDQRIWKRVIEKCDGKDKIEVVMYARN